MRHSAVMVSGYESRIATNSGKWLSSN
ncbi:hypothetical protein MED222_06100 [Vibrio sp. MED222]|nr:hypothetical protein MED222_06100 [Vibrio sp. MED222]